MTRALWSKAWCETRSRWAIGIAALGVVIAMGPGDAAKTVFVLLAIVLGTGGLRQERALGTLGFSLALPVPRRDQILARAAVAIAGVCGLALFVTIWAPAMSAVRGAPLELGELGEAARLGVIWAVCGSLIACLAQLLASLVASDYLVYLGTLLIVIGYESAVQLTALRDQPLCDLFRVMAGGPAMPWPTLGAAIALAAVMLGGAVRAVRGLAP